LQELIEKGLAQNTDVQTASLRVEEAKASLLSAKLAFLPSFALSPQGGINTVEGSKAGRKKSQFGRKQRSLRFFHTQTGCLHICILCQPLFNQLLQIRVCKEIPPVDEAVSK
jgi:hypothetical protein